VEGDGGFKAAIWGGAFGRPAWGCCAACMGFPARENKQNFGETQIVILILLLHRL
jgi:hypothetical protein